MVALSRVGVDVMTEKQFWMKMDQLSESKKLDLAEKAIQLANLIVLAYKEDRWIFYEQGTPLAFENTDYYKNKFIH